MTEEKVKIDVVMVCYGVRFLFCAGWRDVEGEEGGITECYSRMRTGVVRIVKKSNPRCMWWLRAQCHAR